MRKKTIAIYTICSMLSLTACTNQSADDLRETTVNTQVETTGEDTTVNTQAEATGEDSTVAEKKEDVVEQDTDSEANFETADPSYDSIWFVSDKHFLTENSFTGQDTDSLNSSKDISYTVTLEKAWIGTKAADGGSFFENSKQFAEITEWCQDDLEDGDELEYVFITVKIKNNENSIVFLDTSCIDFWSRKEDKTNPFPEYGNLRVEGLGLGEYDYDQSAYDYDNTKYYTMQLNANEEKEVTFAIPVTKEEIEGAKLYMSESKIFAYMANVDPEDSSKYVPSDSQLLKFYEIPYENN